MILKVLGIFIVNVFGLAMFFAPMVVLAEVREYYRIPLDVTFTIGLILYSSAMIIGLFFEEKKQKKKK